MKPITVAICDDAIFLCESFKAEIEYETDLCFAGEAHNPAECIQLVKTQIFDVLLLDIQMETETDGLEVIPIIKSINPDIKIIILTSHLNDDYIFTAFASEVDNYICKDTPSNMIFDMIRDVYWGRASLNLNISRSLTRKAADISKAQKSLLYLVEIVSKLSTGEFEVLKLIPEGNSYREIARLRFVEEGTIRVMASRILKKFSCKNMNQLLNQLNHANIFELFHR